MPKGLLYNAKLLAMLLASSAMHCTHIVCTCTLLSLATLDSKRNGLALGCSSPTDTSEDLGLAGREQPVLQPHHSPLAKLFAEPTGEHSQIDAPEGTQQTRDMKQDIQTRGHMIHKRT